MKETKKVSKRMKKKMKSFKKKTKGYYDILGLKGPKTVGKSTYANTLIQKTPDKYFVIALAAPIKFIVHSVIDSKGTTDSRALYSKYLSGENLDKMNHLVNDLLTRLVSDEIDLNDKESLRKYYQTVGDIMRAEDPDIFINILLDTVSSQDKKHIIVDDIRQFNEGFLCNRLYMLQRYGIQYTNEHISEKEYTADEYKTLIKAGVTLNFKSLD